MIDFDSMTLRSSKMISLVQNLFDLNLETKKINYFFIIGDKATGKKHMAEFIQRNLLKNYNSEIFTDTEYQECFEMEAIRCDKIKIYTSSKLNWYKLRLQLSPNFLNQSYFIEMPGLNDRREDLQILTEFFLKVLCVMNDKIKCELTDLAFQKILQYSWPGNFKELESVLENAFYKSRSLDKIVYIDVQQIELKHNYESVSLTVGMRLEEIERHFILQTLYFAKQNRTKAAEILGISIRTLRNKISQYRMEGFL